MSDQSAADPDPRRAEIAAESTQLGPALSGSLVERRNRCRRRDCACHTRPDQRHGSYLAWTGRDSLKWPGHGGAKSS